MSTACLWLNPTMAGLLVLVLATELAAHSCVTIRANVSFVMATAGFLPPRMSFWRQPPKTTGRDAADTLLLPMLPAAKRTVGWSLICRIEWCRNSTGSVTQNQGNG